MIGYKMEILINLNVEPNNKLTRMCYFKTH